VAFEEIDVHTVPGAAEEALRLANGRKMVPIIIEHGQVTLGFRGGS